MNESSSHVTSPALRGGEASDANESANADRSQRARAARTVALLALAGAALVALLSSGVAWAPARALLFARGSGWLACGMLVLALAVTAVERSLAARWALRWSLRWPLRSAVRASVPLPVLRRALGMGAAWLGCAHAFVALVGPLQGHARVVLQTAQLIAGLSALCVLVLLLLGSFAPLIRASRLRAWKELHRLAYVAALLVVQHVLLGPFAPRVLVLALLATVLLLLAARALPRKRA